MFSGLGTHFVRSEKLPSLREALVRTPLQRHETRCQTLQELDAVLSGFQVSNEG
jgi:hypothetical protein